MGLLIGLAGPSGCGKDTLAKVLSGEHGFRHMKISHYMKRGLQIMLDMSSDQVNGHLRDTVDPRYMLTPRQMLKSLGTDWAQSIRKDIWMLRMKEDIDSERNRDDDHIVISDVRFDVQAELIREWGGVIVHIVDGANQHRPDFAPIDEKSADFLLVNVKAGIGTLVIQTEKLLASINNRSAKAVSPYPGNARKMIENMNNAFRPLNSGTDILAKNLQLLKTAKVAPADPIEDVQKIITEWADEVFPNRTIENALKKLVMEEIPEYLMSQHDPMELADIAILVCDIAHLAKIDLLDAIRAKMEINKKREWHFNPETGLMKHIDKGEKS